ncbi:MAG: hypothetical protein Ct9H300mP15_19890 [Gemmatimonadota bacterium]|nr:MAG: hypothetical protein Ct9H300mP15_19890 [Gemmatimonadota bacterium]
MAMIIVACGYSAQAFWVRDQSVLVYYCALPETLINPSIHPTRRRGNGNLYLRAV